MELRDREWFYLFVGGLFAIFYCGVRGFPMNNMVKLHILLEVIWHKSNSCKLLLWDFSDPRKPRLFADGNPSVSLSWLMRFCALSCGKPYLQAHTGWLQAGHCHLLAMCSSDKHFVQDHDVLLVIPAGLARPQDSLVNGSTGPPDGKQRPAAA